MRAVHQFCSCPLPCGYATPSSQTLPSEVLSVLILESLEVLRVEISNLVFENGFKHATNLLPLLLEVRKSAPANPDIEPLRL